MRLTLRTRINIALAAGAGVLLVFGLAAWWTIEAFLRDASAERASHEDVILLERTVSQLKTAESWQRKFIITADREDLKAYQAALAHVTHAIARLRKAAGAQASSPELVAALDSAIGQRLAIMEEAVRTRQDAGFDAASAFIANDRIRVLQNDIDRHVEAIKAAEAAQIQAARSETEAGAHAALRLILAGGLLSLALLAWATYLVNLYASLRRQAEASLARSVAQLEQATGALRASELQLREVLDTVPVLFGYVDAEQRMRFHNRAYAQSLGLSEADIQGRQLRDILGARVYDGLRHHIDRAFSGEAVRYERTQRHADGRLRDFEINYFPRFGEGEDAGRVIGVYAMGSDITEFKRIDRMKSDFVSTVSHELRTPLTSIRGSLGLIAGGVAGPLPDKARTLVEVARDNCERLVRLVNDILDMDRAESGKMVLQMQTHAVRALIERALAANEGFATQHKVTLGLDAGGETLRADVDPDRFIQVMTNLLSNAVKFSPPGSVVRVRLARDEELLRIEVQDEGPGVPREFSERIFSRFSQADASDDRQKGGTGLGLAISRAIVQMMGGRIGFRNRAEGGAVFFVELPLVQPVEADNAVTSIQ